MSYLPSFPHTRLRRRRTHEFIRKLTQEHTLSVNDLVLPVFVCAGDQQKQEISSMPETFRYSIDNLLSVAELCVKKSIPAIAIFPAIDSTLKSLDAREALNSKGLVPTAIRKIKAAFPDLGIIGDVALDPYTSHGQDGIIDQNGYVLNDETVTILQQQALVLADAGADIIAPSDMMDGRVGAIRSALDQNNHKKKAILSYAAKYASSFYGPFRDAVQSKASLGKADKRTYQLDPHNKLEAISEIALDISEGADFVMVKPGMPYLDIVSLLKNEFEIPVWVYQVSGEYTMLMSAAKNGWLALEECVMESLLSFKRAGASAILSYFSLQAADWIKERN